MRDQFSKYMILALGEYHEGDSFHFVPRRLDFWPDCWWSAGKKDTRPGRVCWDEYHGYIEEKEWLDCEFLIIKWL